MISGLARSESARSKSPRWTGTSEPSRRSWGGRRTRRVHWVRGPILGLQGKALLGMCMGSPRGEAGNVPTRKA